jgi:hypothetical protein
MRLGLIALCLFVIAAADWADRIDQNKKELVRLEVKKTELEIQKLEYELAIYREQESIPVSAE